MPGWSVQVVSIRDVGPDLVALELEAPDGFTGLPGQFILVRETIDGESTGRHYTISSPDSTDTFEITVGAGDDSGIAEWLTQRTPRDRVWIEGPLGRIAYPGDGPVVVLSDGPGVGAAVGVAERAVRADHAATVVHHGPLAHEDRLSALAKASATVLSVRHQLGGAVRAVTGNGDMFVFGFRDFIDAVRDTFAAQGIDPDTAAYGNYGPRP